MSNYIKQSFNKFIQDGLGKVFYDIFKWIFDIFFNWITGTVLLLLFPNILPKDASLSKIFFYSFNISFYSILLMLVVTIFCTLYITRYILKKKYLELQKDNFTDELTGLKNYKALKAFLNSKITETKSNGKTFSLIIMDVDNFKNFNSTYGYSTSDDVLRKLGSLLNNDKRVTDHTFRFYLKGDEFIIITEETTLDEALKASERKRKLIESTTFLVEDKSYNITVSCGITEFKKDDDYKSILQRASEGLNQAKNFPTKNKSISII